MPRFFRRLAEGVFDEEEPNHQTPRPTMKVLVVYHTTYGHTLQLARAVEEGVKSVAGVEAVFRRAPEFPHNEKELETGEGYASKIWKDQ
jgi:NAD(P)H dehydrogenase (quinone)